LGKAIKTVVKTKIKGLVAAAAKKECAKRKKVPRIRYSDERQSGEYPKSDSGEAGVTE